MKPLRLLVFAGLAAARAAAADPAAPGSVVAADGTGQFTSIQAAINAAPPSLTAANPWTIRVRAGTYRELVYVQREKHFVRLVGEGAGRTVLTYDLDANLPGPDGKPIGTFRTPTLWVDTDDFTLEDLAIENSAGNRGQALALRLDGDRIALRRCRLSGWQDTLLGNRGRHYLSDCAIVGAVDFIFGGATEWFDRCRIVCVGNGYVTAASTPKEQPFGLVFSHCRIEGKDPSVRTYLGRPWREFAQVAFLETEMSEVVRPEGWHVWDKTERHRTARYAEFASAGPGAAPAARVPWCRQLTADEARALTSRAVLGGADGWNPQP